MSRLIPLTHGSAFSAIVTWTVKPPVGSPPGTPSTALDLTNYTAEIRPDVDAGCSFPKGLGVTIVDAAAGKLQLSLSGEDSRKQLFPGVESRFRIAVISPGGVPMVTPPMVFKVC